jgi:hypothetical protein
MSFDVPFKPRFAGAPPLYWPSKMIAAADDFGGRQDNAQKRLNIVVKIEILFLIRIGEVMQEFMAAVGSISYRSKAE